MLVKVEYLVCLGLEESHGVCVCGGGVWGCVGVCVCVCEGVC